MAKQSFSNNLGRLKTTGLIEYPRQGMVALTESGRARANSMTQIARLQDLHDAWYSKLSQPQASILRVLIEKYPDHLDKTTLAEMAGQSPTSSGYSNNLGRLKSLGLISYPRPGIVAATGLLFPEGLN